MRRLRHRLAPSVAALALGLAAACQPPASEALTDPREIVGRAIAATTSLRTVTLHAEVEVRIAANPEFQMPARVEGGSMDGAIDLAAGSVRVQVRDRGGAEALEAVVVERNTFVKMGMLGDEAGRWMAVPMDAGMPAAFGMFGMAAAEPPDYRSILLEALAGSGVRMQLTATESCPSGTCYRVGMVVDREATWPLFARLTGLDQMPQMMDPEALDMDVPELSLVLWIDTAALYLVALDMSGAMEADAFRLRLELSEPNTPVSIEAPPAHLVDDAGFMGEGGGAMPQEGVPVP